MGGHIAGVLVEHLLGDLQGLDGIRPEGHLTAGEAARRTHELPEETGLARGALVLGRAQRLARRV